MQLVNTHVSERNSITCCGEMAMKKRTSSENELETNGGIMLLILLRMIVDEPDLVRVQEVISSVSVVLEVTAGKRNIGQVIGRSGRVVDAIRMLLASIGGKEGRRYYVEVIEN
jgi:hypothetical protein